MSKYDLGSPNVYPPDYTTRLVGDRYGYDSQRVNIGPTPDYRILTSQRMSDVLDHIRSVSTALREVEQELGQVSEDLASDVAEQVAALGTLASVISQASSPEPIVVWGSR